MHDVAHVSLTMCVLFDFQTNGTGYHILHGDVFNSHLIPTSELPTHLAIHQLLKKQGGTQKTVLHTHPTELIALTLIPGYSDESRLNKMLFSVQPEAVMPTPTARSRSVHVARYRTTCRKNSCITSPSSIIVWGKHGCVAVGKDVPEAFDLIDVVNKSAQFIFPLPPSRLFTAGTFRTTD